MSNSRITELSARIAANTAALDAYLTQNNLPTPSFDIDEPKDSLVPKSEVDVEKARIAIAEDTAELRSLVLGPREYPMSCSHNDFLSLQAITRFRLTDSFPVGTETTFSDIAAYCGLREPNIRQMLRHAMMMNVFCEPRPEQSIFDWLTTNSNELWQAAAHTCEAWGKYPESDEPNQTSIFEVFSENPERARRFGSAMRSFTQGTGFELRHVVDNIPWASFQDGTVVDVGGSQGDDLESVITAAVKQIPDDVAGRVKLMAHDFLTEQPVPNADAYIFRWIFHNWSDKYCVRILRNLIPALKPGAKIIVVDNELPQKGTISKWQEKKFRAIDLTMAEIQNSRERELDDWRNLFKLADDRFEFQAAHRPDGSNLWIMTVGWKG
ncbi:S-adenosyl-L-methionine-dependent methyltransferase [Xylariaceae sp. FL0594]|nr:S-adenosyl-L-methionine-dependent methyltransferase [Xylariaceae sp. FL0594]